jgi:hypothetical protein
MVGAHLNTFDTDFDENSLRPNEISLAPNEISLAPNENSFGGDSK